MSKQKTLCKRWLIALIAVATVFSLLVTGCGKGGKDKENSITVTNQAGTPLVGVEVYVYRDKALNDLVDFGKTNEEGKVVFSENYTGCMAVLKNVPAGHKVEESYSIREAAFCIQLNASLQTDVSISDLTLQLGDVMSDFTVTDATGQSYVLSDLLERYNAVVLNFWYTSCSPCIEEFPSLQAAYNTYGNKVALLAMNPVDKDAQAVEQFRAEHQLTFPMMVCEASWQDALQIGAYPTTVVVDRYGMITFMHTGSMTDPADFDSIFSFFGADNYVQTVAGDIYGLKTIIANSSTTEDSDASGDSTDGSSETADGTGGGNTLSGGSGDKNGTTASGSGTATSGSTDGNDKNTTGTTAGEVTKNPNTGATIGTSNMVPVSSTTVKEADGSSADKAIDVGSTLAFDAIVPAGGKTYYNLFRVDGTVLTIKDKNAYVVYGGKTYEPVNGVVEVPISIPDVKTPAKIAIGNKSNKKATFRAVCIYPGGTQANPFVLSMGDLTTNLNKGNDQGVTYLYTATQAGTVQVYVNSATSGVKYDVLLYNLNSYANRTLEADGVKNSAGKTVVSVDVKAGDKVQMTVSVLPDQNNEYPAATIKSHVSFIKAGDGSTTTTKPQTATYSATVKDKEGKAMSGVALTFTVGDSKKSVTTNADGYASAELPAGECMVTLTVPSGYIAERSEYVLSAAIPDLQIVLEKEAGQNTNEGITPTDYTVKVLDGNNAPLTDVTVQFYLGDALKGEKKVDAKGSVTITLMDAIYTLKLKGTELRWDEKAAMVSPAAPNLELLVAPYYSKDNYELVSDPQSGKNVRAYYIQSGTMYVDLKAGSRNYFLFDPTEPGTYRITTTNTYAQVGYYGGSVHFIQTTNLAEDLSNNAFTVSVKDVGPTFVLGVDAATNMTGVIMHVTRVGDAEWSAEDEPWTTYKGTHTPKPYTLSLSGSQQLTNFDITADKYVLVYNESDGFYHLDNKNGPVVYLRFNDKAPYISFMDILSHYHIGAYLYDNSGNFLKKEEYTECVQNYVNNMDRTNGVYPLTKDLEYILKQYGRHQGWWDPNSPTYLFDEVADVNLDLAWMFALCHVK